MSKALFEGPAEEFLRAINGVPWAAWDGRVAPGLGLLALIGVHALSMSVLGGVLVQRLLDGTKAR